LTYSKSLTPEGPFDADVGLTFSSFDLTDTDGVCYDPENDGVCNSYTIGGISGTELRYGRMLLQNAHGPETQPLIIPVRTEYYTGSAFTLNEPDNCTAYASGSLSLTMNLTDSGTTTASGSGTLVAGVSNNLSLSAPGVGHEGSVDMELDLSQATGLNLEWLQSDGNNPAAKATFGIFKGNPRLIYTRESVW
jgi:MSHA biogenesis protein MshQ